MKDRNMETLPKNLVNDIDGMATYDYIVNNEETIEEMMDILVENLRKVDMSGQFLASSARFLHAVDAERFHAWIPQLVEGAIEKDKERKYIGSLLEALWGQDYAERAGELQRSDDNFRKIYKRLYPADALGSSGLLI